MDTCGFFPLAWLVRLVEFCLCVLATIVCMVSVCVCMFYNIFFLIYFSLYTLRALACVTISLPLFSSTSYIFLVEVYSTLTIFLVGCFPWKLWWRWWCLASDSSFCFCFCLYFSCSLSLSLYLYLSLQLIFYSFFFFSPSVVKKSHL